MQTNKGEPVKNKREIFIFTKIRNLDEWVFLLSLSAARRGMEFSVVFLKCYSVASAFYHFSC